MNSELDTSRISPTAHYTGHVWHRHALSTPELTTPLGRALFHALQGPMLAVRLAGGLTLEELLVQRHRMLDHRLTTAIEAGRIGQVVEVAGGLSARGWRFAQRYPELTYVEGDLPEMAAEKRRRLAQRRSANHHVVDLNALAGAGPDSLFGAAAEHLSPSKGVAIVTEGLLNYFDRPTVLGMWARFARLFERFPSALYLSDLHLDDAAHRALSRRAFRALLDVFAGGATHLHFDGIGEIATAWSRLGFDGARLWRPRELTEALDLPPGRGPDLVAILEVGR